MIRKNLLKSLAVVCFVLLAFPALADIDLTVHVTDEEGTGISGARVTVHTADLELGSESEAITDESGFARIKPLRDGNKDHTIIVSRDGFFEKSTTKYIEAWTEKTIRVVLLPKPPKPSKPVVVIPPKSEKSAEKQAVVVDRTPGAEQADRMFRGVVAGVTHYEGTLKSDPVLKLDEAARLMEAALRDLARRRGFEDSNIKIKLLVDNSEKHKAPTSSNVMDSIEDLADDSLDGDMLVVYFTGHGTKDYLFGSGANEKRTSSRMRFEDIRNAVERSDAGAKLLFFDTCQVLSANTTLGSSSGFDSRDLLDDSDREGEAWFFSAKRGEFSYIDKKLGYGYYTKHLLDGLEDYQADGWTRGGFEPGSKNGTLDADELGAYLYRNVRTEVRNDPNRTKQTPVDKIQSGFTLYPVERSG